MTTNPRKAHTPSKQQRAFVIRPLKADPVPERESWWLTAKPEGFTKLAVQLVPRSDSGLTLRPWTGEA